MTVALDGAVVTGATDCLLSVTVNVVNVTRPSVLPESKTFVRRKAKRKSWKVTTNHLVDLDNQIEFTSLLGKKVWLSMKKRERTDDDTWIDASDAIGYEGWAWVSKVKVIAQNKDLVKGSFEFTGTGKLNYIYDETVQG